MQLDVISASAKWIDDVCGVHVSLSHMTAVPPLLASTAVSLRTHHSAHRVWVAGLTQILSG